MIFYLLVIRYNKQFVLSILFFHLSLFANAQWNENYYGDGRLKSEGLMNQNVKEGLWTYYYPNGGLNVKENYVDGMLDGTLVSFYPNGNKASFETWKKDERVDSAFYYFPNGVLKRKGRFFNGMYEYFWLKYFDNGQIESIGEYSEGEPHGAWIFHDSLGSMIQKGNYKRSKEHGHWFFYEQGFLSFEGHYDEGLPIDIWYRYNKKGRKKIYKVYK